MAHLRIATFRVDVTPPVGSPLCAGFIAPVRAVADPLFAIGAILTGDEAPLVFCAVDWCELDNQSHLVWQKALADAAGTTPERVALHTVHQHNAPLVDHEAQALCEAAGLPPVMDMLHYRDCVERTAGAARAARTGGRNVDRVAPGSAVVHQVASARRILGPDGKVRLTRWSSAREQEPRDAPEGIIDPALRTVTFLDGDAPVVSLHFYATHPMSYYGDGVVTSDFAGLARERIRSETPGCEHLYLNGCGGDITAGKYNEGTPESRVRLTARMYDAMRESGRNAKARPLGEVSWRSLPVTLPPRPDLRADDLEARVRDPKASEADRRTAALRLGYLRRLAIPVQVSRLRLGTDASILCLPGEPFIEYQLFAAARGDFVAVAGYGDTGTGYIPLARSYEEGGYEIDASGVSAAAEPLLKDAISGLLS